MNVPQPVKQMTEAVRRTATETVKTIKTPLSTRARKSVFKRFFKAFLPQIPAAIVAATQARKFWVGLGLTLLGAVGTALDKCLREKSRTKKANHT